MNDYSFNNLNNVIIMETYFILIDGVSKFEYHSYTLASLKFEHLKAKGYKNVSIMDKYFRSLTSSEAGDREIDISK